ncbi:YppG family protein [Alkalibacillus sp. S2W]|uniref:YppG family protein n=1 Tax=Alkalibacillus sp. S2W TaxID=3386553 RepID=UPI00398D2AC7
MSPNVYNGWQSPVVYYYDPTVYAEWGYQTQMEVPYLPNDSMVNTNQMEWLWHYFQKEDGEIDLDKVIKTLGQVVQLSQQVTPIVKTLSTFVRPNE